MSVTLNDFIQIPKQFYAVLSMLTLQNKKNASADQCGLTIRYLVVYILCYSALVIHRHAAKVAHHKLSDFRTILHNFWLLLIIYIGNYMRTLVLWLALRWRDSLRNCCVRFMVSSNTYIN